MGNESRRGRRPLPTNIKILRGNPGRRPLNEHEPDPGKLTRLPPPPPELSDEAKAEWRRTGKVLLKAGLFTTLDTAQFAIYCSSYALHLKATATLAKTPMLVKRQNGDLVANPLLKVSREAAAAASRALIEFGMSPSSRSRVQVKGPEDEVDPFEAWRTGAG